MSLAARKQDDLQIRKPNPGTSVEADVRPMYDLIELMFFAYRDFVGDADAILAALGFGRAHHRLLHFVARHPGLTIAELLDILKITKQSLNRVLKELVDKGYLEVLPGRKDRRQRQLFPTMHGEALAREVAQSQSRRFARVFASLPDDARPRAHAFLLAMVDPTMHDKIAAMTGAKGAFCGLGRQP